MTGQYSNYLDNHLFRCRCGVFYGPTLVPNQWIDIDCGYKDGILGRLITLSVRVGHFSCYLLRYITIQLLERSVSPSRLEIKEIEMEGWGRLCGHPCLGLNVPAISDYYQVTQRKHGIYTRASNEPSAKFHNHGDGPC